MFCQSSNIQESYSPSSSLIQEEKIRNSLHGHGLADRSPCSVYDSSHNETRIGGGESLPDIRGDAERQERDENKPTSEDIGTWNDDQIDIGKRQDTHASDEQKLGVIQIKGIGEGRKHWAHG